MTAFTPDQQDEISRLIGVATGRLAALIRQGQGEAWHEVSSFQNSWANVGGAYDTLAYRFVNPVGVALKGTVHAGSLGTTIFTLPAAYRPAKDRRIPTVLFDGGNHYPGMVYVQASTGNVQVYGTGPSGAIDEAYLDVEVPL